MLLFLSFIVFIAIGITILLLINKSKDAEKAKTLLKEIFKNLRDLAINIKDLVISLTSIIQGIIQEEQQEKETEAIQEVEKDTESSAEETEVKSEDIQPTQEHDVLPSNSEDLKAEDPTNLLKNEELSKEAIETPIQENSLNEVSSEEVIKEIPKKNEDIAS